MLNENQLKDSKKDYERRLLDKYFEAIKVYWSALLTINGLLMTFFSIDALSGNSRYSFLNYTLIFSCILSIWLLLWNFRTIKLFYYKLGSIKEDMLDVPGLVQQNLQKTDKQRHKIKRRETFVEVLLFLETLLVGAILVLNTCIWNSWVKLFN